MADNRNRTSGRTRPVKKRKKHHILRNIFLVIVVILIAVIGYAFYKGWPQQAMKLQQEAKVLVEGSTTDTFVPNQTGTIYDTHGNVLSELISDKNSSYVPYKEIPENFVKAMVSTEDRNFYKHKGVDFKAIARAVNAYITRKGVITQGGSTITMQIAKNVFLTSEQTWQRKVKQMFLALEMEKKYSKDQIMEFYLNNIYFSNGYYGIAAAGRGYFGKSLDQLDLSQTAFLCAIPNSPVYYDPVTNLDHTIERRNLILSNMLQEGFISQEDYNAAVNETITLDMEKGQTAGRHNYLDTYAYHCAAQALMEQDGFVFKYDFASDEEKQAYDQEYDTRYEECLTALYSGKYDLYTSFDQEIQKQLQESLDEGLEDFTDTTSDGDYVLQGAGVCIDNSTGYVVAEVGGRSNPNLTGYTLNRTYQSYRQPGSSIKPLNVYTPAFEKDFSPYDTFVDQELDDGPENSDGNFYGRVTIREAVERSLNTVAWQLYDEIGPSYGLSFLKKMHFSRIVSEDETLATALGGFTHGVSPIEMSGAYATLADDGQYRTPTCIRKIVNYNGDVIYESKQEKTRVYSENSARMMTDVLTGVLDNYRGTGYGLGLDNGMPAAGKTGTTNEQKDGWFCGYTPYYTSCIWVGCDTPQKVYNLYGGTYPGHIWQSFMNKIHEGLEPKDFPEYTSDYDEDYNWYSDYDYDYDYDYDDEEEETTPASESVQETESETTAPAASETTSGNHSENGGNTSESSAPQHPESSHENGGSGENGGGHENPGQEPAGGDDNGGQEYNQEGTGPADLLNSILNLSITGHIYRFGKG